MLVEKIANWNSQANAQESRWYSGEQLHHTMLALTSYDLWRQNTAPDLSISVVSDEQTLMDGRVTSATAPPLVAEYRYEEIKNDKAPIKFVANGRGEASVVISAQFVPAKLNAQPIYRGMEIRKIIQAYNATSRQPTGPALTSAKFGDMGASLADWFYDLLGLVAVTIEITMPDYASSVVVVDPVAGALEPLDENLSDTPPPVSPRDPGGYWSWYLWGAFREREYLPDRTIFYGSNIWAGTHSVTYLAMVASDGEFTVPPSHAYDAFQPELMGLSAAATFVTARVPTLAHEQVSGPCLPWRNRQLVWEELPGFINPNATPSSDMFGDHGRLSKQQVIGISVGVPLGILVILIIGFAIYRVVLRRKNADVSKTPGWFGGQVERH